MHPGRKRNAVPLESLQATSDNGILLKYCHSVALFSEQSAGDQSSNSASYDDTVFHSLIKCKLSGI